MMWLKEKVTLPLLFSITLFMSAMLMFVMQPMVGKMLTPLFGGAPSTWLAAMVCFQINLLIGYGLAFLLSHVTLRKHIVTLLILLACGAAFLPLHISGGEAAISSGFLTSVQVVLILCASVSIPFIALASLSPSLQRLFAGSKQDPYFLFAASNLGSFGGLIAYPFLLEPFIGLELQSAFWQWGYIFLITLCVFCLFYAEKVGVSTTQPVHVKAHKAIPHFQKLKWVLLAFVPSALMMAVTARVTADTGSVPFFWVVPLALYLLTFVQAFAKPQKYTWVKILFSVQVVSFVTYILTPTAIGGSLNPWADIAFIIAVFYCSALLCHTMLSASRPEPNYLSQFYLWVALGGALGGIFSTFIAPMLFPSALEFLVLAPSCVFFSLFALKSKDVVPTRSTLIAVVLACVIALAIRFLPFEHIVLLCSLYLGLFVALCFVSKPPWMVLVLLPFLGLIIMEPGQGTDKTLEVKRNFFGVIRVLDVTKDDVTVRKLVHGTTVHGLQPIKPEISLQPTTYYQPVGSILGSVNAKQVGMVGLGSGVVLCHAAPNRVFTVYEIDQDILDAAKKYFTYIKNCGVADILIGDGRKLLEEQKDKRFDALVIDAFSSDSIPLHLLTKEAIQLYLNRLSDQGIIAIHVSNRFYDFLPQIAAQIKDMKLVGITKTDKKSLKRLEDNPFMTTSQWVVLARTHQDLEKLSNEQGWTSIKETSERAWTDDFSNMLSSLRIIYELKKFIKNRMPNTANHTE